MICPKCNIDITSMENLTKPKRFKFICKCGNDVSRLKAEQLIEVIRDS
jgi:hypothetical protein